MTDCVAFGHREKCCAAAEKVVANQARALYVS
jgi:hypothetical protein